jgi:DNA-binding NtrC family response regulator
MRIDLQAKLLRVLQEQEFERVGGSQPIRVDVRIIATTNRDLAARAAEGQFRQDLYFRLSVMPIVIPSLRERGDDIPLLAHRFAMRTAAELGKEIRGFAPDTIAMLQRYDWPGNVRELQHAVERAVILATEPMLQPSAFDGRLLSASSGDDATRHGDPHRVIPQGEALSGSAVPARDAIVLDSLNIADAERRLIERALEASNGNRTRAAELLGMGVRTLRHKLNAAIPSGDA